METYKIRKAKISDLKRLTEIYNQAIDASCCTYDTEHLTPQNRLHWPEEHQDERHPVFVCELEEEVVGYSYISIYQNSHETLNDVGKINCYVDFHYHGFGIAKKLINHTIQVARKLSYTSLLAITLERNRESLCLLKRYKFEEWKTQPNATTCDNKCHPLLYYELKL